MSEQKKDLNYYIEHPEEFPMDPEAAARLVKELDVEEVPGVQAAPEQKPADKAADATEKKDETKTGESKPDASAAAPAKEEKKPDGVLTKDGQHVIPYAEMERRISEAHSSKEAEAAARKAAEDYAKELERKLSEALEKATKVDAGAAKPSDKKQDVVLELPDDLMETLRADFPTHAKAIEGLQAAVKGVNEQINKKLEDLNTRIATHDRDRTETVQDEVDTLIGQVPELAEWKKSKPLLWNAALDVEDKILTDKKFLKEHLDKTGVDLAKDDKARYETVVARVKQEVGLPATASPKGEHEKKDLSREAEEKVSAAAPATIRSLSDIQGGQPPAANLEDNLENVPAYELAGRLMSMSEDQRQRWLTRMF